MFPSLDAVEALAIYGVITGGPPSTLIFTFLIKTCRGCFRILKTI